MTEGAALPRFEWVWGPVIATALPVSVLLVGVSVPGGDYPALVFAFVAWFAVGVLWAVGAAKAARPRTFRTSWPLLLVPAVFVASWAAASGDLPGRTAFALYRPELERLAATPVLPPRSVGPYRFEGFSRHDNCTLMMTEDPATTRMAGLAWCRPGTVPGDRWSSENLVLTPIEDNWWAFHHRGYSPAPDTRPWGLDLGRFGPRAET